MTGPSPPLAARLAAAALPVAVAVALAAAFAPNWPRLHPTARWDLHLHGATACLWLGLLLLQAHHAHSGALAAHRRLGAVGLWLGPLVVVAALPPLASLASAAGRADLAAEARDERLAALIVAVGGLAAFALAIGAGAALRKRPALHGRWMALSGVALLGAALQRLLLFYAPGFEEVVWACHGELWAMESCCVALLLGDRGSGRSAAPAAASLAIYLLTHAALLSVVAT